MLAVLPIREGALVHTQELLAFGGLQLEVETPLLNVLANMGWGGRIEGCFP